MQYHRDRIEYSNTPRSQALSDDGDESDLDLLIHFDSLNTHYASESCYREHTKNNFAEAKEHAHQVLDACPKEVIRRFINGSWRFIDSYKKGLTGEAAVWGVKKQKGHRAVSEKAMKAL